MSSVEPAKKPSKGKAWNKKQQAETAQSATRSGGWEDWEDGVLRSMIRENRSLLEIASRLERTWNSVQCRVAYLKRTQRWAA